MRENKPKTPTQTQEEHFLRIKKFKEEASQDQASLNLPNELHPEKILTRGYNQQTSFGDDRVF